MLRGLVLFVVQGRNCSPILRATHDDGAAYLAAGEARAACPAPVRPLRLSERHATPCDIARCGCAPLAPFQYPNPRLCAVASSAASDQADGGLGVCVAQWSGVAGNDWQTTVFGRNIRTEAELFELEEQWEADAQRSELFHLAVMLVAQDEWEASAERCELFRAAKLLVAQEEWEDSAERSALFDVCWNLVEHEEWERDRGRSNLFKMAAAHLESESESESNSSEESDSSDCDTLVLPPHLSRQEFNALRLGVKPLVTVVVDEAPPVYPVMGADPKAHAHEAHASPNNVAALYDAFSLPALELAQ